MGVLTITTDAVSIALSGSVSLASTGMFTSPPSCTVAWSLTALGPSLTGLIVISTRVATDTKPLLPRTVYSRESLVVSDPLWEYRITPEFKAIAVPFVGAVTIVTLAGSSPSNAIVSFVKTGISTDSPSLTVAVSGAV